MKTTKITYTRAIITCLTLGCTSAAQAATFFDSNFDGTALSTYGSNNLAQITAANLNAGTSVGSWTVEQAQTDDNFSTVNGYGQKSIQGELGANTTNKVLNLGSILDGPAGLANPYVTADLSSSIDLSNTINVGFDYAAHAPDGNTNERGSYLTGVDGSGNRLFQIYLVNTSTANDATEGQRIAFLDSSGNEQFIGTAGGLNTTGDYDATWDPDIMKNISVSIDASSYSISLNGASLATGIAFRDAAASGLESIEFATNSRFTSGWIDNVQVTQIPEPSSTALLGLGGLALILRRRK